MKKNTRMSSLSSVNALAQEASDTSLQTLGTRLRHYRESLALSQDELAVRVGASQQTIQSLESGKIKKSTFLPHIAKELGVDFEMLVFNKAQPPSDPDARRGLMTTTLRVPLFSTKDCALVHAFLNNQTVQSPTGKWVSMDHSLPFAESGSRLFALKLGLSDEAFQPEFLPGDQLVIDPDAPIQPSDSVIVFKPGAERLNLSRYRVLSHSGDDVDYELISFHPDFPSFAGTELKSLEILGPVIQMRRPISSRVRAAVLEEQFL